MSSNIPDSWWNPQPDWDTPAGRLLQQFARFLPSGQIYEVTVFGSAPLQLTIEPDLLSGDVDVFSQSDVEGFIELFNQSNTSGLRMQLCYELNFITSPKWKDRSHSERMEDCIFRFPHPLDILIGKLHRLEPKDLEAFQCVLRKTSHPTESELLAELQEAVDIYRPGFDESSTANPLRNTVSLWQKLYGKTIDVREQIIKPALIRRTKGFAESRTDYKSQLRKISAEDVEPE